MFESLTARLTIWKVDFFVSVKLNNLRYKPRVVAELSRFLHDQKPAYRAAAAKALGVIGNPDAVEPLIAALADGDAKVRQCAARALGELKDARAVEPLIKALGDTANEAATALGMIGDLYAIPSLISSLCNCDNPFPGFNHCASDALSMLGEPHWSMLAHLQYNQLAESDDPHATEVLIKALSIKWLHPMKAVNALGRRKDPRALEPLLSVFTHENHETRMAVLNALVELNDLRAIDPLIQAMKEHRTYKVPVHHMNDYDEWDTLEERDEAALILVALGKMHNPCIIPQIIELAHKIDSYMRDAALEAARELYRALGADIIDIFTQNLKNEDVRVRITAVKILGALQDPRAVEPLKAVLNDIDARVRIVTAKAIQCIQDGKSVAYFWVTA